MQAKEYLHHLIEHRISWLLGLDEPEGAAAIVVAQVSAAADALVAIRAVDRRQADEIVLECEGELRSLGLLQVYSASLEVEMRFASATDDVEVFHGTEGSQEAESIEPVRIIPVIEELGVLGGCRMVIPGVDVWSDELHLSTSAGSHAQSPSPTRPRALRARRLPMGGARRCRNTLLRNRGRRTW